MLQMTEQKYTQTLVAISVYHSLISVEQITVYLQRINSRVVSKSSRSCEACEPPHSNTTYINVVRKHM